MADNVAVTPGTGATIATDDVGGVQYQRVKVDLGGDGAASPLVRGQQAKADSIPVALASDDPGVVSLQLLDDAVKTDDAAFTPGTDKVLMIGAEADASGPDSVDEGDAGALRMTLDRALHVSIRDSAGNNRGLNIDASGQLAVTVPTDPFGANADAASDSGSISAKLRGIATALGITAFDLGSGTGGSRTLRWFHDTAQWIGGAGAVTSATQRVTHASDDPVTASVQIMDDWDESDRAKVNPIVGQAGIAAGAGAVGATVPRVTLASDDPAVASLGVMDDWDSSDAAKTVGFGFNISTDITRPADTTAYAANDCLSDSTSAPTTFTLTSAARISGGSGIITDLIVVTDNDPATTLQGEIWLFPASVTSPNDNAAFALSDADMKTCIGKIPFALEDAGNNGFAHISGLSIAFTCSGSANLRFLVRVKNAYTPASAEVVTVRIAGIQTT